MTFYLVKAKPKSNIAELYEELNSGRMYSLKPFGKALQHSLENAKIDDNEYAMWIEEDYCSPPLAMERDSVLNRYFDDIIVIEVRSEKEGWNKIKDKRLFWTETK